jgi:hypothetical protein
MGTSTARRQAEQLGMPFGTAAGRLRLMLLFQLAQQTGRDACFKCSDKILTPGEFSIEHKLDWLDQDPNLFWDLSNIAFSHRKCNRPAQQNLGKSLRQTPEGMQWCAAHREFLPTELFTLGARGPNRTVDRCQACVAEAYARKYKPPVTKVKPLPPEVEEACRVCAVPVFIRAHTWRAKQKKGQQNFYCSKHAGSHRRGRPPSKVSQACTTCGVSFEIPLHRWNEYQRIGQKTFACSPEHRVRAGRPKKTM